jgi:hypothetical protein
MKTALILFGSLVAAIVLNGFLMSISPLWYCKAASTVLISTLMMTVFERILYKQWTWPITSFLAATIAVIVMHYVLHIF